VIGLPSSIRTSALAPALSAIPRAVRATRSWSCARTSGPSARIVPMSSTWSGMML
jgi:hypothetical protein